MEKLLFAWSSGKDSALALQQLGLKEQQVMLLTTITEDYERISMHGVREVLLDKQAESLGLEIEKVYISKGCSDQEYEEKLEAILKKHQALGVQSVVFGDIFLEDLKKYREDNLAKIGMRGIFPLWKRDTAELAREFILKGFKAVITCVDLKVVSKDFSGREYDEQLIKDLPKDVDPCGENGEFHTFVYDGPIFSRPIVIKRGQRVTRADRFFFCDLLPLQP